MVLGAAIADTLARHGLRHAEILINGKVMSHDLSRGDS